MKRITFLLLKIICRIGLPYLIILLFAVNLNPLEWSTAQKIWLVVLSVILLTND